jgi:UDP-glucose 4-epimerase
MAPSDFPPPSLPAAPPTVLVTGGAGFIGSHVVDRLLASGLAPRIYDLRSSPHHPADAVETVRGDLRDLDRLCRAMQGCDAVLHLAAAADVDEVRADPVRAQERNAGGTLNVLEAARRTKVRRVVYASTVWVYSDTEADPLDETVPLNPPGHLYTATKLAGELYCRSYQELYGVEHTILRFGIPYGPRARPSAVIPSFVAHALAGRPLPIVGDGSQSRRFVYVEDLADAVVRALAPVAANRVYNLVGGEDITVVEIARTVDGIVGGAQTRSVPGRTADFSGAPVSGARASAELGWAPMTPFREGVRRYVEWHRAQAAPPSRHQAARAFAAALLRRGALAFACTAAIGVMLLGLLTLVPLHEPVDPYDAFGAALVLLAPLVLAAGFDWDPERARWLRAALWMLGGGCLAVILLPWPALVDRVGDAHRLVLALFTASALVAAQLPGLAPRLRQSLPAAGD